MASDNFDPTNRQRRRLWTASAANQNSDSNVIRAFPRARDGRGRFRRTTTQPRPPSPRKPAPEVRDDDARLRNNRYAEAVEALFTLKGKRVVDMSCDDEVLSQLQEMSPRVTKFVIARYPREAQRERLMIDIIMAILQDLEDEGVLGPGTDSI